MSGGYIDVFKLFPMEPRSTTKKNTLKKGSDDVASRCSAKGSDY